MVYVLEQKIRKQNVYPCKPQFNYMKVGCKGVFIHGNVIIMVCFDDATPLSIPLDTVHTVVFSRGP